MSPKTIEATGKDNESKYRSGRGTGLLSQNGVVGRIKSAEQEIRWIEWFIT